MPAEVCRQTTPCMGTLVTIEVVGHGATVAQRAHRREAIERGFEWCRRVETCCTRFDPTSELMRLCARAGEPVRVSDVMFEAVSFALAVAERTHGAFDPTVGGRMESRGFNREHRTGEVVRSDIDQASQVSYRDVRVDPSARTITLARPLVFDLGAVAKGLAVDLAVRALAPFEHFAIDAGGDLYLSGRNRAGEPWAVGVRHPRQPSVLMDTLRVSDAAVCTSGDYARVVFGVPGQHHILDPRTAESPTEAASVTVVAPTTMVGDALATAAFVLGPQAGLALLEQSGVRGFIVSQTLERHDTRHASTAPILQDA